MPATSTDTDRVVHSPGSRAEGIFWFYAVPIALLHALACLAFLPYFFSWTGVASVAVGLYLFATLGINLGYHRLLAHRSLQVPQWLEYCLSTLALCSLQTTPARWVATHRLHHNHSDEPEDPHSPEETFLWSHLGWLLYRNSALQSAAVYDKYARDLLADPYYWWLEKRPLRSPAIYLAHAVLFFAGGALAGWALWGPQAALQFGSSLLVWGVFVRTVLVWHITWSVNSLTHLFGYRSYETDENSRNNWLVGLVAMGEGWHNNHHHDPASASVQHRWWEVDSTYYSIRVLESLGLARKVIRPRHVRQETTAVGRNRTTAGLIDRAHGPRSKRLLSNPLVARGRQSVCPRVRRLWECARAPSAAAIGLPGAGGRGPLVGRLDLRPNAAAPWFLGVYASG